MKIIQCGSCKVQKKTKANAVVTLCARTLGFGRRHKIVWRSDTGIPGTQVPTVPLEFLCEFLEKRCDHISAWPDIVHGDRALQTPSVNIANDTVFCVYLNGH